MVGGRARLMSAAVAAACILLAAYLIWTGGDERRLEHAASAGVRGDFAGALHEADGVSAPAVRARGDATAAYALAGLGRFRAASSRFAEAVGEAPRDWELRRDWALVLTRIGDRGGAAVQMAGALALNPRMALPRGFVLHRGPGAGVNLPTVG